MPSDYSSAVVPLSSRFDILLALAIGTRGRIYVHSESFDYPASSILYAVGLLFYIALSKCHYV